MSAPPVFRQDACLPPEFDFHGAAWQLIKQYVEERIAELRLQMEDLGATEQQRRDSAVRIAELRELIGKETVTPRQPRTPVRYDK